LDYLAVQATLRSPSPRHYATRIKQTTVAKEVNTVISPDVDVAADVKAIRAGKAIRVAGGYIVNNRTYGVIADELYPVSGEGFYQLNRGAFKALGVFSKFGETPQAAEILAKMKTTEADRAAALEVWRATKGK